jgi:hypothetical protein
MTTLAETYTVEFTTYELLLMHSALRHGPQHYAGPELDRVLAKLAQPFSLHPERP